MIPKEITFDPIPEPLGDSHHCDVEFTAEDEAIAHVAAWHMGTLFSDVEGEHSRYWYHERTSLDEWRRVARALRIHGLMIVDRAQSEKREGTSE